MKYNPITKQLFTNYNQFIKELHCPLAKQWEELTPMHHLQGKMCDSCQQTVFDTAVLTDNETQALVNSYPHTCLKVDLNQPNITLTYHEHK